MALDVTRVTVLGGSRKRVTTRDRRGTVAERDDVRWRALLRSGESRMFRQRFDRAADADQFVSRLRAVGLPTGNFTVRSALLRYRSARAALPPQKAAGGRNCAPSFVGGTTRR